MNKMRCEGWTRHGGAFTFGPVKWTQCKNEAVVMLNVTQDGKTEDQPACMECWNFAIGYGVQINSAIPIEQLDTDKK